MKYLDTYEIALAIEGQDLDIKPQDISLSIKDSIYDLYPTSTVTLNDRTGLFQESLLLTKGNKITVSYGYERDVDICDYIIYLDDEVSNMSVAGVMGGDVFLPLIHFWYAGQNIKSTAYEKPISTIIKGLLNGKFKSLNIETTDNADIWYQPLMTDAKFIQEMLLPNCFSLNAENTPFYAYGTTNNVFNLKSLRGMHSGPIKGEFNYFAKSVGRTADNTGILQIRKLPNKKDTMFPQLSKDIYYTDIVSSNQKFYNKSIYDYGRASRRKVPLSNNYAGVKSYIDFDTNFSNAIRNKNDEGLLAYLQRETSFIDRFLIVVPLNTKIHAGDKIQFNIYSSKKEDYSELSSRYTGQYIVISSEKIWAGPDSNGHTMLTIGRKYIDLPNTYTFKDNLLKE